MTRLVQISIVPERTRRDPGEPPAPPPPGCRGRGGDRQWLPGRDLGGSQEPVPPDRHGADPQGGHRQARSYLARGTAGRRTGPAPGRLDRPRWTRTSSGCPHAGDLRALLDDSAGVLVARRYNVLPGAGLDQEDLGDFRRSVLLVRRPFPALRWKDFAFGLEERPPDYPILNVADQPEAVRACLEAPRAQATATMRLDT